MKPQVVTIHKIFSDANMPPEFDEIDEKEGSNDDSDGEDHRRFNLESPRLFTEASYCSDASRRVSLNEGQGSPERLSPLPRFLSVGRTFRLSLRGRLGSFDSGKAWNVKKSGELMGVDLILVDGKEQAKLQICGRPCFAPIRRGP
ncbi:hypothetical protein IGI04_026901 [Brassica rapa subsp. trilocularis]|uniref:Uncharacterized protein n=1 Tax=Brassica rapa subsp. trilocularis TaxID=1813537 RepID=A0ABQ7KXE5_BRACM|nr:hypothetical protein IGI04_026901 [Brassica rapa subsp. trilocularis]